MNKDIMWIIDLQNPAALAGEIRILKDKVEQLETRCHKAEHRLNKLEKLMERALSQSSNPLYIYNPPSPVVGADNLPRWPYHMNNGNVSYTGGNGSDQTFGEAH